MRMLPALLLLTGCAREISPREKAGVRIVDGVPQLGEVEIELGRTDCEGWCPAYTVKLGGDGTLTYTGRACVKTKGERTATFDPERLLPLLQRLAEFDFLSVRHTCSVGAIDNDHAWVALRIGTHSNSVGDAVAGLVELRGFTADCPADEALFHRELFALENAIDTLANIESWIGTEEERRAHMNEWR